MGLVKCRDCGNEVSERAPACPKCGAPRSEASVSPSQPSRRPTHPLTWVLLIALIGGAIWYQVQDSRRAALPPMPVKVQFRKSLLGPRAGYVLMIENTSSTPLPLIARLTHAAVSDGRSFDLYIPALSSADISKFANGWITEPGDRVRLENSNFQPWTGSIP